MKEEKKLKILIACLYYSDLTGSELYVYELAKNLVKLGHEVSVLTTKVGGITTVNSEKLGIKVFTINNPPGYDFVNNKFYKVKEVDFDIINCQHKPICELVTKLYPRIPKVATIHSEIISLENPHFDSTIKKYISIRPEIKNHLVKNFNIPEERIEVVYNPIDTERFNTDNCEDENYLLFVGSLDYLRRETINDLITYTEQNKMDLYIIGSDYNNIKDQLIKFKHVKYFPPIENVEDYVKKSKMTAGILLGRTTIESWFCGKPSWIYNVDAAGNIKDKKLYEPEENLERFDAKKVTSKILDIYYNEIKK